jgi:hypothetical protein
MHGEHETKRYAPGPEPIFSAATQNRPPPGTACREGTACVLQVGCAAAAQDQDGTGRLREIKGEEACDSARRRTFAQAAGPVLIRHRLTQTRHATVSGQLDRSL